MPSDDATTPYGSRRARRARRRRIRQRSLILGAVVALLVAGTAFAVAGPLRDDDIDTESQRALTTGVPATAPAAASESDPEHPCRSPLDPADPLRLWIGGDSLAGSLGASLDAKTLQDGAERDPDWRTRYSELVEEMLVVLAGNGRAVYWVGAPVMADSGYSERVRAVNEVFRDVAAKHPGVVYVDAYAVFSTPDGTYAQTLPVPGGTVTRVRGADGIHFTPEGGDLLATTVFDRLDPACRVTQQAVEDVVKPTIGAKGSSSEPGTRRERR